MNDFVATLKRAQNGHAQSIQSIVSEFEDDVRFVCLQFQVEHIPDLSRSDLLQDALVRIWLQVSRFQIHENSTDVKNQFRAWIRRVARNEMIHVLEKRQAKKRLPPNMIATEDLEKQIMDNEETPRTRYAKDDEFDQLQTALQSMSAEHQRAIEACFFEKKSVRQFAEDECVTYSQARHQLASAINKLRILMGRS